MKTAIWFTVEDAFDGNIEHWKDTFFSNPTEENIKDFCEKQGWKLRIIYSDGSWWDSN